MPRKRKTHEEYVEELINKNISHIPLDTYITAKTPITHKCTGGHEWLSTPHQILGGLKCPKCPRPPHFRQKSHSTYVEELKILGKDIEVLESYINNITPILHRCQNGHEWKARPNSILSKGIGCPKCSVNRLKTSEEYVQQMLNKNIHFEILEEYNGANQPILHKCTSGHVWKPTPSNVLRGQGCPSCAPTGFNPDLPAILYYIKIENFPEIFYKIGITNNTVSKRFEKDRDKTITVLLERHFEKGSDALKAEKEILKKFKSFRQNVPDFLKSGGNTELFEEDILELDK